MFNEEETEAIKKYSSNCKRDEFYIAAAICDKALYGEYDSSELTEEQKIEIDCISLEECRELCLRFIE